MLGRRATMGGVLAGAALASNPAPAQTVQAIYAERLKQIQAQAQALGITRLGAASVPSAGSSANVFLSLAQLVDDGLRKAGSGDLAAAAFVDDTGKFLADLNSLARDPAQTPQLEGPAPPFGALAPKYKSMFQTAALDPGHAPELARAARMIATDTSARRYRAVADATKVPWYVIGALHYREANLNFMGHLHNGDFLRARTVQVPRNQPNPPAIWPPDPWDANEAWRISAENALAHFKNVPSWSVEQMLYAMESYNGWGYRAHPGFNTPYLWNYTKFYNGGGFPADHVWSSTYRSKQAGLVGVIKALATLVPGEVKLVFET